MGIIPLKSEYLYSIIYCPRCKKYYSEQVGPVRINCAVHHAPGDCCHYGDIELSPDQILKIKETVEEKKK